MNDATDAGLLENFVQSESEEAFAELVRRHIGLVYSVALRKTNNPQHAEEITQAVFIVLARKAASLKRDTVLSGWLYHAARLTASNFRRSEFNRVRREQEAFMQSTTTGEDTESAWREMGPLLEDAMAKLGSTDRDALVLRFFENKSLREVGVALGMEEWATQKRVSRSLEKLRAFLVKHGVTLSVTMIATVVSANSVQAAPMGVATAVTAAAIKGTTTTASILTLIKGTLKLMAWAKAKTAILISTAVILATGSTTLVLMKTTANTQTPNNTAWADDPKYWELDFGDPDPQKAMATQRARDAAFEKRISSLPPVLILRPTRFRTNLGYIGSGDKIIARGKRLFELMSWAYDPQSTSHLIMPPDFPKGQSYDLMLTLPNQPREALQNEIKTRFGFVAHLETIETNILSLRVKNPGAPALQATKGGLPTYPTRSPQNKIAIKNQQLAGVAACFGALLKTQVVNETGIQGNYDVFLEWQPAPGESNEDALKRTILDQLGLELVPGRKSFEYLIIEKAH